VKICTIAFSFSSPPFFIGSSYSLIKFHRLGPAYSYKQQFQKKFITPAIGPQKNDFTDKTDRSVSEDTPV
jgi:hypothetical protein